MLTYDQIDLSIADSSELETDRAVIAEIKHIFNEVEAKTWASLLETASLMSNHPIIIDKIVDYLNYRGSCHLRRIRNSFNRRILVQELANFFEMIYPDHASTCRWNIVCDARNNLKNNTENVTIYTILYPRMTTIIQLDLKILPRAELDGLYDKFSNPIVLESSSRCPECHDKGQTINADGKTDGCLSCGKTIGD